MGWVLANRSKGFVWEKLSSLVGRSNQSAGRLGGQVELGGGCRHLSLSLASPANPSQEMAWQLAPGSCRARAARAGGTTPADPSCMGCVCCLVGTVPALHHSFPSERIQLITVSNSKCL